MAEIGHNLHIRRVSIPHSDAILQAGGILMNNFKRTLVLTCILAVSGVAQRVSDAERDLEAAVNKEVVQGDVNNAIGLYRKILSRYGSQREIAAKALFHLGQCHEKLGQAEARKSYERIVKEFADQKDLAAQARLRLVSLGGSPAVGFVRRVIDSSGDCGYVTRDDQWAACSRNGNLYVRNLSSGKETLTARDVGQYDLSVLSTDGRWVAYMTSLSETLWLSAADGSSRRKIEGPANKARSVAFSDDNSALFVFYLRQAQGIAGEIWVHPVQGGPGRKLYESRNLRSVINPIFSPDGQFVVYLAGTEGSSDTHISVLPIKGGEPWEVPAQQNETPVGFTSDGKLVLHSRNRGGSPSLWTLAFKQMRPEGQPRLLAPDVPFPGQYHASGKFYYHVNANRAEMLSAQLEGNPPLITRPAIGTDESRGSSPDYSIDGKLLAYGARNGQPGRVVVRNLGTGSEKGYDTPLRPVSRVRWYPNSSALLVFGYRGPQREAVCVKLDLGTGGISDVVPAMGMADGSLNPTFSPDGRYIYYKRFDPGPEKRRVHRYELSSGKEEEVYRAPGGAWLRLFSISPDGRQIAIGCADKNGENWSNWIGVAPLAGGETKVIYRIPPGVGTRGFSGLAWAADSKSILFQTMQSENSDVLWRVALDGSPAQRLLTAPGIIDNIAVHPNGREITFANSEYRRELWVMEGLK